VYVTIKGDVLLVQRSILPIIVILGFVYVFLQGSVDRGVTVALSPPATVIAAIGGPMVVVALFGFSRVGSVMRNHQARTVRGTRQWAHVRTRDIGVVGLAAIGVGVIGYFSVALIVPYIGGDLQHGAAVVRAIEKDYERYGRNPRNIRCSEYIVLTIGGFGDREICLKSEGLNRLTQATIEPGQRVKLTLRSNFFGTFVESIAPM